MNRNSVIATGCATFLLLSGCANNVRLVESPQKDIEPILVGIPIDDRINSVQKEVNGQLELLKTIQDRKIAGTYTVVKHQNELDARKGSAETIPAAYASSISKGSDAWSVADSDQSATKTTQTSTDMPIFNTNLVKKIEWQNNSMNVLAENLAKEMGYQLVIKPSKAQSDKNVNFAVKNKTLRQVVEQLATESSAYADVIVIDANKTLNVLYK